MNFKVTKESNPIPPSYQSHMEPEKSLSEPLEDREIESDSEVDPKESSNNPSLQELN